MRWITPPGVQWASAAGASSVALCRPSWRVRIVLVLRLQLAPALALELQELRLVGVTLRYCRRRWHRGAELVEPGDRVEAHRGAAYLQFLGLVQSCAAQGRLQSIQLNLGVGAVLSGDDLGEQLDARRNQGFELVSTTECVGGRECKTPLETC